MADDGLTANTVHYKGDNGDEISGYLARPTAEGPWPGVVVIHEVFGLVSWIKQITRNIADNGYIALAPDLHHREGPGDPSDVAAIVRGGGGNPDARTIGDVGGAMAYLRALDACSGKIGSIGFCSGGRQSYLVACNIPTLDAAVVCYGGRIVAGPDQLNEAQPKAPVDMTKDLGSPLLGLFGAEDGSPSPENVATMEAELKRHGKTYEFRSYDDAGHGFFADYRTSYRQHAAVDGWERVFAWYEKYLK